MEASPAAKGTHRMNASHLQDVATPTRPNTLCLHALEMLETIPLQSPPTARSAGPRVAVSSIGLGRQIVSRDAGMLSEQLL